MALPILSIRGGMAESTRLVILAAELAFMTELLMRLAALTTGLTRSAIFATELSTRENKSLRLQMLRNLADSWRVLGFS